MIALVGMLVLLSFIAGGIVYASYQPRFSIGTIRVEGTRELSPETVRAFVEEQLAIHTLPFISPRAIFAYDRAGIERALSDFSPRIASAHASRASLFSTELVVALREREPYALW